MNATCLCRRMRRIGLPGLVFGLVLGVLAGAAGWVSPAWADSNYPTPTMIWPTQPPPPLPTPAPPLQIVPQVIPTAIPVNDNPGNSQPLKAPNPLTGRPTLICLPLACGFALISLIIAAVVAVNQRRVIFSR